MKTYASPKHDPLDTDIIAKKGKYALYATGFFNALKSARSSDQDFIIDKPTSEVIYVATKEIIRLDALDALHDSFVEPQKRLRPVFRKFDLAKAFALFLRKDIQNRDKRSRRW